jgi:hypothetical protein
VNRPGAGKGAEIAGAVAEHSPCDLDLGEGVLPVDLEVGVALVVLEAHIVPGAVLLDQGALEDQRLQLGLGDDIVEVGDVSHHASGLGGVMDIVLKVRADARAQVDALADIDHVAGRVFHQVDAGSGGKLPDFLTRIGLARLVFCRHHP